MDKKIVKVVYDDREIKLVEKEKIKSREQIKDDLPTFGFPIKDTLIKVSFFSCFGRFLVLPNCL